MNSDFEWQFGGWLRTLSPALSWSILGCVAIGGSALIILLYRRTLRKVPPRSRLILTLLRAALLLVLCILLANPSRLQHPGDQDKKNERHLAVILDRSGSMESTDNRNETRLQNAVRVWRSHTEEAGKAFDQIDHYRFASKLEKVDSLEDALKPGTPGEETQLWSALRAAMQDAPAGIVCLTDGLDTTGGDANAVTGEAQKRGIPLYFVPGKNRSRPGMLLSIRDVKTPSKVLRLSKFNAAAIAEISTPSDREVPIALWSGTNELASAKLQARAGWNVLPWTPEVSAREPGAMPLEFRLGEGSGQETAASTTQVVEHTSINILYYQGALQWGYRFLRAALESDPSFKLTSILNPALGVKITAPQGTTLDDLPDNAADLKPFQIVILAHVLADQLTQKQQQALVDYTRAGGGVLFIAPDNEATNRFAGTPLEAMLPVVFEHGQQETEEQRERRAFEARVRAEAQGDGQQDSLTADGAGEGGAPALLPFQVTPGVASVFRRDQPKPLFSNYARVQRAKAAAEVLAVHPTERTAENAPRILMARQQFGSGFTVAMATDLLWRWKMSLPSTSRAAETFWQQLMMSLAPSAGEGLRIVKASSTAAKGHVTSLLVAGTLGETAPKIEAIAPSGQRQTLAPVSSRSGWEAVFTPNVEGRWQLVATDAGGDMASMSLPVQGEIRTKENSNAPPDIEGMRRVAEATGGALIESNPVFEPENASPLADSEVKTAEPLWNQSWMLGLLLGIYATELVVRRAFRLL